MLPRVGGTRSLIDDISGWAPWGIFERNAKTLFKIQVFLWHFPVQTSGLRWGEDRVGTYTGSVGGSMVYLAARSENRLFLSWTFSPILILLVLIISFVLATRTTSRVPDRA